MLHWWKIAPPIVLLAIVVAFMMTTMSHAPLT